MNKKELLNKLMDMPKDIEAKENDLLKRQRTIQELNKDLDNYKLSVMKKVYEDSKDDPDKKLSSEVKRNDEIKRRLKDSSIYQNTLLDIEEQKSISEIIKNKISRIKREFVAIEITLRGI